MSSATRLLVLGAIRIMQPVHGYHVRRELVTWRLEEVANVRPGSVYGAIRTLERDGCIAVHARDSESNRPERTAYVLTPEGEKEFTLLLREAWWTVRRPAEPLIPALCLMLFMPRDELVRALQSRVTALESELAEAAFTRGSIADGATGADGGIPEHVREIFDFTTGRIRAEITWARQFIRRIRAGAYCFVGDPGFSAPGPDRATGPGPLPDSPATSGNDEAPFTQV
ncbi:DNA-binding transcriptional regulator, PadR family [Parafrankia irregularis]|uniref:DNA-binding transcriptional regulator, PadR family n=1 Tax=Parafrankia irregularis TaxID=795642 RepID=A0A0S4QKW1_9ACTN|nr:MULTISPECIES: PadR family transcriptional regulator [Parafrankia]MBE3201275.1 PadR family transcriptional regulator [Parafrankia sp. CH37]CUU56277.1 DNA-binding transcriptional regulator, PadR family [Parafrankia irregularis]